MAAIFYSYHSAVHADRQIIPSPQFPQTGMKRKKILASKDRNLAVTVSSIVKKIWRARDCLFVCATGWSERVLRNGSWRVEGVFGLAFNRQVSSYQRSRRDRCHIRLAVSITFSRAPKQINGVFCVPVHSDDSKTGERKTLRPHQSRCVWRRFVRWNVIRCLSNWQQEELMDSPIYLFIF